jgi:twinkle protein
MTPQELNQTLAYMADSVAAHLLPSGKRIGHSWCAGSVNGEEGQSLRVCIEGSRAGVWSDFSSNTKGGDMLSLWQQCRGLSFVETLKEAKEYAGVVDEAPAMFTPKRTRKPVEKPKCTKPTDLITSWFEGRNIFPKSLEAYKVGQKGSTIVFPFLSPKGDLELVKYRDISAEENGGKKKIWSNEDPQYHLWGWQAIDDNVRDIVICEGEIDALSWYQQGIPALSIPQGAGGGDKQETWIQNDYDRLQRFETIYISMDMDVPGQQAIKPIISRLGIERCKVVVLTPNKDANEAHVNGEVLSRYLQSAKTQDPEELSRLVDHHDEIMAEFRDSETIGTKLPWWKTFNTIRLRPSEISVWGGINSHGKSIALSHVAVDAISQGEKVCIASMEMKPRKLGRKMYQQVAGKNSLDKVEEQKTIEFLGDNLWLFEVYGTAKASRIIEVFSYARKRYGITHFIVDSLAKCGFGEDDYNGQKAFVDRLMEFAGENNVHVHLVLHIRKKEDESKVPGKMDIKGTGAITDMVDNLFIWWRNKPKELLKQGGESPKRGSTNNQSDAVLNCEKQRETGIEPMVGLYWHGDSCQFLTSENDPPKQYIF